MLTDRFLLVASLILLVSAPMASAAMTTNPSLSALNGPIGKIIEISGTAPANKTVSILFGGVTVATTNASMTGLFRSYFVVPLFDTGKYNVSITSGGVTIGVVATFQITYGIDNITNRIDNITGSIQSIQSGQGIQSIDLGEVSQQLSGISSQLSQIISVQSKQVGELQNLTSNQNISNPSQTTSFQQNLLVILSVITAAALATTAFSIYSLQKLKRKKFEELEILQSG
jgi:hypothetical protein